MNCPFCDHKEIVNSNRFAYTVFDKFPVSQGHTLIIPYRHVSEYFSLTHDERAAILELVDISKNLIDCQFHPDGYNLGFNIGECAGQTVLHVHCHLIPRYRGDVSDPRGGIRAVIPEHKLYGDFADS